MPTTLILSCAANALVPRRASADAKAVEETAPRNWRRDAVMVYFLWVGPLPRPGAHSLVRRPGVRMPSTACRCSDRGSGECRQRGPAGKDRRLWRSDEAWWHLGPEPHRWDSGLQLGDVSPTRGALYTHASVAPSGFLRMPQAPALGLTLRACVRDAQGCAPRPTTKRCCATRPPARCRAPEARAWPASRAARRRRP